MCVHSFIDVFDVVSRTGVAIYESDVQSLGACHGCATRKINHTKQQQTDESAELYVVSFYFEPQINSNRMVMVVAGCWLKKIYYIYKKSFDSSGSHVWLFIYQRTLELKYFFFVNGIPPIQDAE